MDPRIHFLQFENRIQCVPRASVTHDKTPHGTTGFFAVTSTIDSRTVFSTSTTGILASIDLSSTLGFSGRRISSSSTASAHAYVRDAVCQEHSSETSEQQAQEGGDVTSPPVFISIASISINCIDCGCGVGGVCDGAPPFQQFDITKPRKN